MQVYSRMEQTKEGTYKKISKYFERKFKTKTFQINLLYEKKSLRQNFSRTRIRQLIRNCTRKVFWLAYQDLPYLLTYPCKSKIFLLNEGHHNQTISMYLHIGKSL